MKLTTLEATLLGVIGLQTKVMKLETHVTLQCQLTDADGARLEAIGRKQIKSKRMIGDWIQVKLPGMQISKGADPKSKSAGSLTG